MNLRWPAGPNNNYVPWYQVLVRLAVFPLFVAGRAASALAVWAAELSCSDAHAEFWRGR